jgi:hypothetical protein
MLQTLMLGIVFYFKFNNIGILYPNLDMLWFTRIFEAMLLFECILIYSCVFIDIKYKSIYVDETMGTPWFVLV